MTILKMFYYLLAFTIEMAMLVALGYWGFQGDKKTPEKYLWGLGLPLVAIVLWWLWAAPKALQRLDQPWLLAFKLVLFGVAAFGLYRSGQQEWAYWLFGLALVQVTAEYLWFS